MLEKYITNNNLNDHEQKQETSATSSEDDVHLMEDRTEEEIKKTEEDVDLYNIKNFSI